MTLCMHAGDVLVQYMKRAAMVIATEQEQVQELLQEAITKLCKDGFTFRNSLSLTATIKVTVDQNDTAVMKVASEVNSDAGSMVYSISDTWGGGNADCSSNQPQNCPNNLIETVKVEDHRPGHWIPEISWQLPTPKISSIFHHQSHGPGQDSSYERSVVLSTPVYQPNVFQTIMTSSENWPQEPQGYKKSWDLIHDGLDKNQVSKCQSLLMSHLPETDQPHIQVPTPSQKERTENEMNLLKSVRALCENAMNGTNDPDTCVKRTRIESETETDVIRDELEAECHEDKEDSCSEVKDREVQHTDDQKPPVSNLDENSQNVQEPSMPRISLHKQGKEYKCSFCSFVTDHGSAMSRHLTIHQREPLKCDKCTKVFSCPSALRTHTNTKHLIQIGCKQCSDSFSCRRDLREHHRLCHTKRKNRPVVKHRPHSQYSSKNSASMQSHLDEHAGTKVTCHLCNEQFEDLDLLKGHLQNKHEKDKLSCDVCSKEFRFVNALKKHKEKHTAEIAGECETLRCSGCDFTTLSVKSLEKHTGYASESLACKFCGRELFCRNEKRNHMKEEHPMELRKKVCEFCSKEFHSRQGLYTHRKVVHGHQMEQSKREVYTCHVCGKGFPVHVYLTRHLKSHDSLEPYQCPKCHKTFKYHRNFKSHKDGCLNTEGFQCDVCGKSLKTEYTLKIHVRSMHSDKRMTYPCRHCGAPFFYQQSRNKHERLCNPPTAVDSSVAVVTDPSMTQDLPTSAT